MLFEIRCIVPEMVSMARGKVRQYFQSSGYTLLSDASEMAFERGSALSSWLGLVPKNFKVRISVIFDAVLDGTSVTIRQEVRGGSSAIARQRPYFQSQLVAMVNGLGGQVVGEAPAAAPQVVDAPPLNWQLSQQLRGGANWFYWIAGMSAVNTFLYLTGSDTRFIIGLGMTQVIDIFAGLMAGGLSQTLAGIVSGVGLALSFALDGLFVVFGIMANRYKRWAFIVGMVLYALDTVIFLLLTDWFALLFHGLALFGLWRGTQALNAIRKLSPQ